MTGHAVLCCTVMLLVSGTVQAQTPPPAARPASGSTAAPASAPTPPAKPSPPAGGQQPARPAGPVSADYVIGPGDTIQVFVWRNPELTTTVPVRPDGKISTPLVEDMPAVGKTPAQLARDVERVLGEYVRSPQVNVIVTQPASAFSQVKVIGQVKRPSAVAYREGMKVLDALLAVDGVGEFSAPKRSRIVRTEQGRETEIKVNLDALLNRGDMSQNLPLKPGDVLVVPESRF